MLLLLQARPQASDVQPDGSIAPCLVAWPMNMSAAGAAAHGTATQELDWTDVWRHTLADADAAVVARLALDDTNAAVRRLLHPRAASLPE